LRIAWLLYGDLKQLTGGTIYDARIVAGLGDVEVVSLPRRGLVRSLAGANVIVGDELCFRELAYAFPRLPGAKRVLLVHHLTCWEPELRARPCARARLREAQTLRAADVVITTSHATAKRLEHEGYRRPITVVQPGADRLVRGSARPRSGFLFVGAVIPRKRVRELIEALPESATLRIAGSLTRDPRYVASLPKRANITYLGELSEAALAEELASADALVMPSSLEGYGIAATEALHAGLPVIATRTPGLEEALAPCRDGVLFVDPDLASALRAFPPRREAMQAAAANTRLPTWAEAVATFRKAIHA
jgi:glycosyltransferase involved in cell wall biosynthesis